MPSVYSDITNLSLIGVGIALAEREGVPAGSPADEPEDESGEEDHPD
jgi:hypothetical protein